jgi:hypothetical protein
MENTFNPVEIAEDKDATIAQLRYSVYSRDEQIKQYSEMLSTMQARLDTKSAELSAFQAQPQSIDAVVSAYTSELVSSLLEGNDIRKLIEAAVDNHIELALENGAFNTKPIDEAIEQYIEHCDIDCEDAVTKAIEEALEQVEIKFHHYGR